MASIPTSLIAKLSLQVQHTSHQDQLFPQREERLDLFVRRISVLPSKRPHHSVETTVQEAQLKPQ